MLFITLDWAQLSLAVLLALVVLVVTSAAGEQAPAHYARHKATWLATAGGVLSYVIGGPLMAGALIGAALVTAWTGITVGRRTGLQGRPLPGSRVSTPVLVVSALVVNLLVLVAIHRSGHAGSFGGVLLPFGASLFTLHAVSFLLDLSRGQAPVAMSPAQSATYLLLFPQISAGPIGYSTVAAQLAKASTSMSDFSFGVRRFLIGLGKIVLIANTVGIAADYVFRASPTTLTAGQAWLGVLCFSVQVYFLFSGYADLAIGIGRTIGLRQPENFRWPYVARTVNEFWQRWHITITTWFEQYLPARLTRGPLGGASGRVGILAVLCCAVWYGFTWGLLLWGLYHAAFLMFERLGLAAFMRRLPVVLRHAYLLLVVAVGWVFVRADTLAGALGLLRAMAGLNHPASALALPVDTMLWLALTAGIIGSAPLASMLSRWAVVIDSATMSALMMLFATGLFVWRFAVLIFIGRRQTSPRSPL